MRIRVLAVSLLLSMAATALAQVDTVVISGRVFDRSGAVLPETAISITSTNTNYHLALTTNSEGLYASPPLPAGRYRVEATRGGFQSAAKEFQLEIGEAPSVDFALQVAAQTSTVEVQAVAPVLNTETSTLSTVRSLNELQSLPINERNFAEFIRFAPGAVPAQANKQNLALSQERGNVSDAVNGTQFGDNNFLVDGLQDNNNHQGWGLINYPELEAIDQFTVETSVPDARFDRSGATVNVAYKSGTDNFHGDVFEYLRNTILDARNFFATGAKPVLIYNDYGGVFGGPLAGKNRHTFFFLSYEGHRIAEGNTFVSTVPTPLMRSGNFSELLTEEKTPVVIYDPTTTVINSNGVISRKAFSENIITPGLINSTSQQILNLYPKPNKSGLANNYLLNPVDHYATDQGSVKLDHYFNNGSRLAFRLTNAYSGIINTRQLGPVANPYLAITIPVEQGVLSYTTVFSSHMTNEARFGLSRENASNHEIGVTDSATQIGIPNVNVDPLTQGYPIVTASGLTAFGAKGNVPSILVSRNTEYADNFNDIVGKHNLKAGVDAIFREMNAYQASYTRGEFDFTTLYTDDPAVSGTTGFGAADLLLGAPLDTELDGLVGTRGLRRTDWTFFLQDDWKVTPKLTVNLGLQYLLPIGFPNTEAYNRMEQFNIATGLPSPVGQAPFPWRSGVPTDRETWAPRVGIAYRVANKTVIRAAYGLYYQLIPIPIGSTLVANPPLFINTDVINSQSDFAGARLITDGPLRTTVLGAPGQSYFGIVRNFRVPNIQEWNATVQQALPGGQQLTVAYVGTKGTHLLPITGGQDNGVNWNLATPGTGAVNLRQRWPNDSVVDIYQSNDDSIYHALQVTLVKRWSTNISTQLAYTYSHLIDDEDPSDLPINYQALARGNGDYDLRQQFRGTFNYQLPFGRGKTFLAQSGPIVNGLVGGWQLNGVVSFYTGFPFSVIAAANTLNNGSGSFPNVVGPINLPASQRSVHEWFNLAAFTNPGPEQYGNAGRNILFGPGTRQLDASLVKEVTIREHQQLQFRAEAFNLPNHPLLDPPNGTLGSPSSGTITAAGSDTTLQRTERQFQLALKYIF